MDFGPDGALYVLDYGSLIFEGTPGRCSPPTLSAPPTWASQPQNQQANPKIIQNGSVLRPSRHIDPRGGPTRPAPGTI